jgi:hypothetical protein
MAVLGCIFFANPIHAATPAPSPILNGGLTVSPLRTETTIAPGESRDGLLTVDNRTKQPATVHMSAEKFSVVNQQYDYSFSTRSPIVKWVSFSLSDFVLGPGETKKITYTIGVPVKSEPGGQYISIFAATDTQNGDQPIKSEQRVASLIYLTVQGKISRIGHVLSLNAPWLVGAPSTYSLTLQNSGTTHFRSNYSVQVEDLFGHTVAQDSGTSLVLPGSVRLVSDVLPAPRVPGIYKAVYSIGLGDTPNKYQTRIVVYTPAWSVAALMVLVAMAVVTFFYIRSIVRVHREKKVEKENKEKSKKD